MTDALISQAKINILQAIETNYGQEDGDSTELLEFVTKTINEALKPVENYLISRSQQATSVPISTSSSSSYQTAIISPAKKKGGSGYTIFSSMYRKKLDEEYGKEKGKEKWNELGGAAGIGKIWKELSEEEKNKYKQIYEESKLEHNVTQNVTSPHSQQVIPMQVSAPVKPPTEFQQFRTAWNAHVKQEGRTFENIGIRSKECSKEYHALKADGKVQEYIATYSPQ